MLSTKHRTFSEVSVECYKDSHQNERIQRMFEIATDHGNATYLCAQKRSLNIQQHRNAYPKQLLHFSNMANKFIQIDFGKPVDFSALTFSVPRKNPSGGSSVSIQYNGKTPIFELPSFYVFPPSIPEGGKIPKLTAKLPNDKYKTPETDEFRRNIETFNNVLIDRAITEGRGAWVPNRVQKLTPESVSAVMNPLIKVPEDPNKSPLFNCKFDGWDSVTTEIFDAKGNVVPLDAPIESIIPMGTIVKLKVVPKVWVNPNGFGVTFTIKKLKKEPVSGGIPRGVWDIDAAVEPAETNGESAIPNNKKTDELESSSVENTLQVADSDDEAVTDPDAEYTPNHGSAAEEEPPIKGRKKVKKTN